MEKITKELHDAIRANDVIGVKNVLGKIVKHPKHGEVKDVCSVEQPRAGTALHVATKVGNIDIISLLLQTGIKVNFQLTEGFVVSGLTPLHVACTAGNCDVATYLVAHGADIDLAEADGRTALHCACQGKNLSVIAMLLQAGAKVDKTDSRGETPLQTSVLRASTDISEALVEAGADINVVDKEGQSTLHYAAEWGNLELTQSLLRRGADVNQQDREGRSPLHVVVDDHILQVLVDHGGDVNLRDKRGKPPVEKPLDMDKEEYQNLNAALSRHADKSPATRRAPQERVQHVQQKFNNLALAAGADDSGRSLKASLMSELLGKTKEEPATKNPLDAERSRGTSLLASSGVLGELMQKKRDDVHQAESN